MASKLLRNTSNRIFSLVRTNPNPNFPLKQLNLTACQALLSRPYSDVAQPVPIEPSLPEKPPVGGGTTNGKKIFCKGTTSSSSLKAAELAKFAAIAETWWDAEGPFKPLHVMNPTRLSFIRSTLCRHFRKDPLCPKPLEGLKVVDVGCGGGILSEPLARMGATVTGIDAVEKNITIARLHADSDPLTSMIEYRCTTAGSEGQRTEDGEVVVNGFDGITAWVFCRGGEREPSVEDERSGLFQLVLEAPGHDLGPLRCRRGRGVVDTEKLVEERREFDAVIALEVIEHVADPAEFCKSLAALTVSDGATVISTINRSMRSYATAIIAAEYILQWLPKGTHQWSSFLTPEELTLILQRASITVQEMAGFVYNPLTGRWSLSDDISVNFIAFGTKNHQ
ncbi:hypothetical protein RHGRI_017370 [Rhododendron griersonianum]|uniref:Ubiquinone biosynthesis O-methyltransferase, mitochondrial n=1 Tax=Rhododendron griersonianum TaxID=479676 RepID=A0AAV6JXI4_9ERIC|nr:hypothetical protein RHGRI_017370 [Rhododendron griersonianum]